MNVNQNIPNKIHKTSVVRIFWAPQIH